MKQVSIWMVWLLLLGLALALVACGAEPEPTPAPTPTSFEVPTPMLPPPTARPTEGPATATPVEPTEEPAEPTEEAAEPTEEPVAAAGGSETCIACHTSEETLQALAEEEKIESDATSGEG